MADIFVSKDKTNKEEIVPEKKTEPISAKKNLSPFDFGLKPSTVKFEIQDEGEEIILFLRRHWITNLKWVFITIILIAAPLILKVIPIFSFLTLNYQLMGLIVWYLFVIAFIFEQFLSWYFNVYIVTNERIIDYDFYSLLYKDVNEAGIDKIQDTSVMIGGISRVLFNYGDVLIQTAGAIPEIKFEAVPNPDKITKILHDIKEHIEGNRGI